MCLLDNFQREFFGDQVVIGSRNPDGVCGCAYLLLFTSKK